MAKDLADKLIALRPEQTNLVCHKEDFTCSSKTMYQKLHQGFAWLLANEDPDKIYAKLRAEIKISNRDVGIVLAWKTKEVVEHLKVSQQQQEWKIKIEEFLENPTEKRLELTNIALSGEQLEYAESLTEDIPGVLAKIRPDRILLVRADIPTDLL